MTGWTARVVTRGLRPSLLQAGDALQAELHPPARRAGIGDATARGAEVVLDERLAVGYLLPAAGTGSPGQ